MGWQRGSRPKVLKHLFFFLPLVVETVPNGISFRLADASKQIFFRGRGDKTENIQVAITGFCSERSEAAKGCQKPTENKRIG